MNFRRCPSAERTAAFVNFVNVDPSRQPGAAALHIGSHVRAPLFALECHCILVNPGFNTLTSSGFKMLSRQPLPLQQLDDLYQPLKALRKECTSDQDMLFVLEGYLAASLLEEAGHEIRISG
jgi:hypothetical protein